MRWKFILEYYGTDIEYIHGSKIIVADSLPRFTIDDNEETTQESTYKK